MRPLFRGVLRATLSAIPVLALVGSSAQAQEVDGSAGRGFYAGVFGGGGGSGNINMTQTGYALYRTGGPPDLLGPLSVNAQGTGSSVNGTGVVGVQFGQEWSARPIGAEGRWGWLPAIEFEAYYLGETQQGHLVNPTPRLTEHEFINTYPINSAVFMGNFVLSLQTPLPRVHPYVGVGLGTSYVSIDGADCTQILFPETVNHYNSGPNSARWTFAAQVKTGCRFNLSDRVWLFGEYRFQTQQFTDNTFGQTVDPNHIPTTDWNVHLGSVNHHLAIGGIGVSF